jgi:hypothetical protein
MMLAFKLLQKSKLLTLNEIRHVVWRSCIEAFKRASKKVVILPLRVLEGDDILQKS